MRKISASVILLLTSTLVLADINTEYQNIIDGESPISVDQVDEIYSKFVQYYKSELNGHSPSENYSTNNVDRKSVFAHKLQEIIKHNSHDSASYKKGLNAYSDMTDEEFFDYFNLKADQNCSATNRKTFGASNGSIPTNWDWRTYGVVSPVKNQGKCGSCWTFSTVGALESHFLLKYGQFRNLSEQQLVDCAGDYDNHGCNGGLPSHAFEYLKDNGGIAEETSYPYVAVTNTCALKKGSQSVGVKGGAVNVSLSEDDLKQAIYSHGPVSIAFQVASDFRDYRAGVYNVCKNGPQDVNHAVLAVGFGTDENKVDYWIIKNSWGAVWGDQGYFKMERGVNMCGVSNCNSYPYDVTDLKQQTFLQLIIQYFNGSVIYYNQNE